MNRRMAVGAESFARIRQDGSYYVDKTEFIYDLVHETHNMVSLFTRPRRFGKSLMLSTLENFFDIRLDSKAMFEGLDIAKHEEFCAQWMNQYPVLFVTLKDVEALTYSTAYAKLKGVIADLCMEHNYLGNDPKIDPADRKEFERLKYKTESKDELQHSLKTLTRMMSTYYGKPVILLLDEYDLPLSKAKEEKEAGECYYPQMLEVIRGLLSSALASNDHLKFGVVTGCLPISMESIFTAGNNCKSYSVLEDSFGRYFGFSQEEVDLLLKDAGLEEKRELFKAWYDGYFFGDETVYYCPWDVVNFASDLLKGNNAKPKNYWKNTRGNEILRDFVERFSVEARYDFETLLNGGTITKTISEEVTYENLFETEENFWSILLMRGYLTKAGSEEEEDTVTLRIPNTEIASIYRDTVVKYFSDHVERAKQESMMEAFWSGDEATASKIISDFLWDTVTYMDYGEDYYHTFLAGIFSGQGFALQTNRERDLTRPDLRLMDHKNRRILILEANRAESASQMDQECKNALKQIIDQEYAKGLDAYQVFRYGIAFYQKSALVKQL